MWSIIYYVWRSSCPKIIQTQYACLSLKAVIYFMEENTRALTFTLAYSFSCTNLTLCQILHRNNLILTQNLSTWGLITWLWIVLWVDSFLLELHLSNLFLFKQLLFSFSKKHNEWVVRLFWEVCITTTCFTFIFLLIIFQLLRVVLWFYYFLFFTWCLAFTTVISPIALLVIFWDFAFATHF